MYRIYQTNPGDALRMSTDFPIKSRILQRALGWKQINLYHVGVDIFLHRYSIENFYRY